jgi:hypothetical protein
VDHAFDEAERQVEDWTLRQREGRHASERRA